MQASKCYLPLPSFIHHEMCTELSLHSQTHSIIKGKVSIEIKLGCKAWEWGQSHTVISIADAVIQQTQHSPWIALKLLKQKYWGCSSTIMSVISHKCYIWMMTGFHLPWVVFDMIMGKVFKHWFSFFPLINTDLFINAWAAIPLLFGLCHIPNVKIWRGEGMTEKANREVLTRTHIFKLVVGG